VTNPATEDMKNVSQNCCSDPFSTDAHPNASPPMPTPVPASNASKAVPR
jgi:hypothetical protein